MPSKSESIVREYFAAAARRDLDAMAEFWAPDARWHLRGVIDADGREEVRDFFRRLFRAVPDWTFAVERTVAQGDAVAVHWRATGTFTGDGFMGLESNGARIDVDGLDLIAVRDGKLASNDAFMDGLTFVRQLGLLPERGSSAEARVLTAFNTRTKVTRRISGADLEPVAEGVWRLRGGVPARVMNVYLLEEPDGGVTVFDAGVKQMAGAIAGAAATLGGLKRVVLGHAHPDHRGAAALLRVPVLCHPAERADAEGDGGRSYSDMSRLTIPARWTLPRLLEFWDAGPVSISGTVEEGDEVAGFRVVHFPGHAPGQIALVRDRLALTSDVFYVIDIGTGRPRDPGPPESAFNQDDAQTRESMRRLAALDLEAAWPGHGEPLRGDVRGQLERAAG